MGEMRIDVVLDKATAEQRAEDMRQGHEFVPDDPFSQKLVWWNAASANGGADAASNPNGEVWVVIGRKS